MRKALRVGVATIGALCACYLTGPAPDSIQASTQTGAPTRATAAPTQEMRVDINRASVDELLRVPGLTRTWAGRIVRFRPYRTKQDLMERGIVPNSVYNRIKDYIIAHRDKP